MAGSTFGKLFKITTWGESHGPALGVVIDGCPAGFSIDMTAFDAYMKRRQPGLMSHTTSRKESDKVQILSGVFEGKTLGTPISIIVFNEDAHSSDYEDLKHLYRPGHGDATYDFKYGIRDYRGGGRSSGRETLGRVAAGALATQLLGTLGITFSTSTRLLEEEALATIAQSEDSIGGGVTVEINGVPAGLGEPVFDKLDARLGAALLSIGGVKAVEIGSGKACESMKGSTHNDVILEKSAHGIHTATNYAGGILAGISNGEPIIVSASIKPTPSIGLPQQTITDAGQPTEVTIRGRHDTTIVKRAAVVVESMCAITLVDCLLEQQTARFSFFTKTTP
ncbi:chorismate synthase [Lachnospiraceae bacterium XBB1006]|nr:chorismate synthase [Lachnospiraceae bacterium XBB1006]